MADLPIVARCTKCGRGFVSMPRQRPAFDKYGVVANPLRARGEPLRYVECGGEIIPIDPAPALTPDPTRGGER